MIDKTDKTHQMKLLSRNRIHNIGRRTIYPVRKKRMLLKGCKQIEKKKTNPNLIDTRWQNETKRAKKKEMDGLATWASQETIQFVIVNRNRNESVEKLSIEIEGRKE